MRVEDRLTRTLLLDLACGLAGAVVIRGFLSDAPRMVSSQEFRTVNLSRYSEERYPIPAFRLGPVLNEYNEAGSVGEKYWPDAQEATEHSRESPIGATRAYCVEQLAQSWTDTAESARSHGRELFWGIVREINEGTLTHWDDISREFDAHVFDDRPIVQLAFNLFLSMPSAGGETWIWRRRWQPSDENHRERFGYRKNSITAGAQRVVVSPTAGDAVLFDPRNYHVVRPSSGGRRLTVSFFIGITARGRLILWS
ncbi:hypothetical protein [Streptomyces sp. CRN 30]|uniref:2OG-Fe(II)-dependent halogenase WelO5 family protein n=1 Tax=Streptomyces sp. CRN 30 TaxID=3075613 RepID=UPI002A82D928|nr:hypothetical protein [Streptomyces sp. CRN 30]